MIPTLKVSLTYFERMEEFGEGLEDSLLELESF